MVCDNNGRCFLSLAPLVKMSVCRACLATSTRLHDLRKSQLQHAFEKLTNIQLGEERGGAGLCYVCLSHLRRCLRFIKMSQTADNILHQAFSNDTGLVSISLSELSITNNLIVTPVECITLGARECVAVKVEPIVIKEEVDTPTELEGQTERVEVELEITKLEETGSLDADVGLDSDWEIENQCNACGKILSSKANLNRHIAEVHNTKKIKCKHCRRHFTRRYIKKHMSSCTGEITLKDFDAKFSVKSDTDTTLSVSDTKETIHKLNNNSIEDKISCDECGILCVSKHTLKMHMYNAHTVKVKLFACTRCDKKFTSKGSLTSHLRVHTGEKPYSCHICVKAFSELSSLRKHIASHSKEKRYVCDLCDKGFTYKPVLVTHLRTHSGEKPFRCQYCAKTFSQLGHLRCHVRLHEGVKPFSCQHCGKAFTVGSTLRKHLRSHSGARPYRCHTCGDSFAAADTLASHSRTHSGERPYVCGRCHATFSVRANVGRHVKQCYADVINNAKS